MSAHEATPLPSPDASPASVVAAIAGRGRQLRTPCGAGSMLWHLWGDGPPLVLLHGGHGSWTHWLRNVEVLSERFQVLAPDMPGYGDSDLPPGEADADLLAGILAAGLEQIIGAEAAFAIAGFSFGGVVGGHLAARMPERVSRLVLLGAGGLALPRPPAPRLIKWRDATPEAVEAAHRTNLAGAMLADPTAVDALAVHLQTENTRRARLRSRSISMTDALLRRLEAQPLRLGGIWGERDAMTGEYVDTRRALLSRLDPGCPFVVIPGAGHWAQYEAPDAVHAALLGMI